MWTITAPELGRTLVSTVRFGTRITLDLHDGGGFCPSVAVWRIGRRVLRIERAGSA